ncbi:uncharacterized protein LOC123564854 [Mercenaria mercenaria]|uniref:uncharacterized protein LOC123564854 n=1 Tax=Mercenaria mercenaria TaxID=6596 RepID=UPI001E1D4E01|nr:uncharacterized protein LOC123564854 [Mercenaria mercenaria]
MQLLLKAGLLFIVLQVVLQIVHGQVLNLDDNRTIKEELPSSLVRTNAPGFTKEHWGNVQTDSGPGVERQNDLQMSKIANTAGGKENPATMAVEESVSEILYTKSSSEIKATKASVSELKTDHVDSDQVTGKPKHSAEHASDVSVDPSMAYTATTVDTDIEKVTEKSTEHKTKNFVFPDPIGDYSNTIMLEGHVFGIRDQLVSMIHDALSSGDIFVPVDPLRVDPLANSYEEMGYEGDKVTHIRYIVSYNGKPIHTTVITRLMSSPKVHHHFQKQLEGKNFRQYKEAKPIQNKSWIHQHVAAVVIPSCVAFVLIILVIFVVVARKRSSSATKLEKKRPFTSGAKSEKKCPPPPYSVENPTYDFETNAVMDGYTLP